MGPFQLIPYSHNTPPEKFTDLQNRNKPLTSCTLQKVLVKFPDNVTEVEQDWLNESYVDLTISDKRLYFKVRKYTGIDRYVSALIFLMIAMFFFL